MESQNGYYQNDEVRRESCGKINYYDSCLEIAGLEKYKGTTGELYFKNTEK